MSAPPPAVKIRQPKNPKTMYATMNNATNFKPRRIPASMLKKNCMLNTENAGSNGILNTVPDAAINKAKMVENVHINDKLLHRKWISKKDLYVNFIKLHFYK